MPFAIAAVGGALIGGYASNRAANTQAGASDRAAELQVDMFQQTQRNLAPYMQSGQQALEQLNQGIAPGGRFQHEFNLQDFQASPAYNFNLQQGQQAIDKAANARGNFYAPQTLQDISRFSQGLASNEFQNAFSNYNTTQGNIWNRLQTLAGSGQNAAVNLGTNATAVGGQVGSNIIGAGNARAAGQMGVGNAIGGAFNQYGNAAMYNQMLRQQQQGTGDVNYIEQDQQYAY